MIKPVPLYNLARHLNENYHIEERLGQYVEGKLSALEDKYMDKFLADHPEYQELLDEVDDVFADVDTDTEADELHGRFADLTAPEDYVEFDSDSRMVAAAAAMPADIADDVDFDDFSDDDSHMVVAEYDDDYDDSADFESDDIDADDIDDEDADEY